MLVFETYSAGVVGGLLATYRTEHYVFKAVVLSIVLTVAVAPAAAPLCKAQCHPPVAVASACHDEKPSAAPTGMTWDDPCTDCDNAGLGAMQFFREDVWRGVSALDAVHAILVPRHQFAHSTIDARPGQDPGREWSLEPRRLPGILRI